MGRRNAGRSFERGKQPTREPKRLVLIVCEGEETEINYFTGLRRHYRIKKELIEVLHPDGTHPKNIVEFAKKRRDEAKKDRLEYDYIWCVFDRDEHLEVTNAIDRALSLDFKIAFSNPSFEFWFLIHFVGQNAHIERDKVLVELKKHLPEYEKSMKDTYSQLLLKQQDACRRAKELREEHRRNRKDERENPSTNVDELIEFLIDKYKQ